MEPEFPGLSITEIDVVKHPLQAWQNGIRLFPALVAGKKKLAGIVLSEQQIRAFLTDHMNDREQPKKD